MSTLIGDEHASRVNSIEDLVRYFQIHAKAEEKTLVGLEAEFFGISRKSGHALPYHGKGGIADVLDHLASAYNYERVIEDGNTIALKRGQLLISLEPGGQVELSAPPVVNIFEIERQLSKFQDELRGIAKDLPDAAWLAVGIHPFSGLEDIEWVPKHRYEIMAGFLAKRGRLAHHMMKRTATNHINMDYTSEENAMANLRVVLALGSIVSALFANSSFSLGKPNGFATERVEIWNHTDPARCGIIPEFIRPGKTFEDYVGYIVDLPVIFIVRSGRWIPVETITFREYMRSGFQGTYPTHGDFELQMSCAFPEARLKPYLEIRCADCQSAELIPAVAAFWKGLLYDGAAREKAWDLVSYASQEDFLKLHTDVPQLGLKAKLAGRPIFPIAEELVNLSCASLAKQQKKGEDNECVFLERIRKAIIRPGKSPGETLLDQWAGPLQQNPQKLIEYLSFI